MQAVNEHLKPGATLIVASLEQPTTLLKALHTHDKPYKLGVVRGVTSFSGMWVYKDDHTDVRILGAIAKALPELLKFSSLEKFISEKLKNTLKVTSARTAFDKFSTIDVKPGTGNAEKLAHFDLIGSSAMRLGVSIPGQRAGRSVSRSGDPADWAASARRAMNNSRRRPPAPCVRWSTSRPAPSARCAG